MNRFRVLKIIACFLVTFVAGGIAGWHLKPVPPPRTQPSGPISASQRVMDNLDAELKLSKEQKQALRPLLDEWGSQAERLMRFPRRRRDLFEAYAPRIRPFLRPDQLAAYDKYVQEIRVRWDKVLHGGKPGAEAR